MQEGACSIVPSIQQEVLMLSLCCSCVTVWRLQTFKPHHRERQGLTKAVSPELQTKKRALTVRDNAGQGQASSSCTSAAALTERRIKPENTACPVHSQAPNPSRWLCCCCVGVYVCVVCRAVPLQRRSTGPAHAATLSSTTTAAAGEAAACSLLSSFDTSAISTTCLPQMLFCN